MTHAPGGFTRFVLASLALMCAGVVGCREEPMAPTNHPPPIDHMANLGTVIVDVDMVHNTVRVHPLGESVASPEGVDARFFGEPGSIEHVVDSTGRVSIGDISLGVAEYHLRERINNLQTFAIGTNSIHTAPVFPQDTMGVYVYNSILPFNIQTLNGTCVTGCTVAMDSMDGTLPFTTSTPQPYVYFKTILEGGGPSAPHSGRNYSDQHLLPGGIDYYRMLHFRATGSVTNFSFGLSISAAWVDPNESRWKVFYQADSVPNRFSFQDLRSEPDWRVLGSNGSTLTIGPTSCAPSACQLTVASNSPGPGGRDTTIYYRSDSLRAAQEGYITATMTASNLTGAVPAVFLGLRDPAHLVQLGISGTLTGFTDSTGAFVGTPVATDVGRTTWRVAKFGTDSAVIYSPANNPTHLVAMLYGVLPPAPVPAAADRSFFFGNLTQSLSPTATSVWTNVTYEIGAHAP